MKKVYLSLMLCIFSIACFARVVVNQGFENAGSLPSGRASSIGSGSYNWTVTTTGGSPSCSPHAGAYMMRYQSYSQTSGGYALLVSPVIDWSARGGLATSVTVLCPGLGPLLFQVVSQAHLQPHPGLK